MLDKLQSIYEEVTGDYDTKLDVKMKISDIPSLSSLGKVQLVYAIEEHFDIDIPSKEIRKFKSIKDIVKFLESIN